MTPHGGTVHAHKGPVVAGCGQGESKKGFEIQKVLLRWVMIPQWEYPAVQFLGTTG